jgi:asparagine synthase (glutamine-hydrolysing)
MCGIYGYINYSGFESVNSNKIHLNSLGLISHRGPDNSTLKLYNTKSSCKDHYNIALGHNRLSIIDLNSNSDQPYEFEDFSIVFNGEIFNYLELKEQLKSEGVVFQTDSDTEVLLQLYIHRGVVSFNELNGMWSFSILDKKKNKLILSRDRFGIKPLYYINHNNKFVFSSEIKQLLGHLDVINPNEKNIKDYLSLALLDHNDETFFKDVFKLPSSTCREIDLETYEYNDFKYWDIEEKRIYTGSYENAVKEYKELFESAVKIRLRSDVPIGNTLSGGLDSSSISVVANKFTPDLLNFSVVSEKKRSFRRNICR